MHGFHLIVLDRIEIQKAKHRLVKREVDHLPFAAAQIAMIKRDHDRERAEDAGDEVAQGISRRHRRPVRLADEMGKPAHRFGDATEAGATFVRPGLAESRDAQENNPRIDTANDVGPDAPSLKSSRPVVLHDRVFALDQLLENLRALGFAQIEGDAALVARHRFPPKRNAVFDRLELALAVAVFRVFDLDHVGAEVGEQHGGERRRHHVAGVDDAHPGQRLTLAFFGKREIVVFLDVVGHFSVRTS